MKKCLFSLIAMLLPSLAVAGTHLSGKVTGADGKRLALAHVHLTNARGDYRQPLQTVTVHQDGHFALPVPEPGLYRLFVTAANHRNVSIPLLLDAVTPEVKLDAQLALLDYKEQFDAVQIIGDWNGFRWDKADTLQEQPDGTFVYERPVQADTVAYQLLGITREARSVNGTQTDYYVYDGGGDYISVRRVKPGQVRILFEPKKLRRTTDKGLPRVVFGKENTRLQKVWDLELAVQKRLDAFQSAATAYRESHDDMEGFRFDWSETVAMLKGRMHSEADPGVRGFATIQLGQVLLRGAEIDSTTMDEMLERLPPSSPLWSLAPWVPTSLAFRQSKEKRNELLKTFVEQNPDRLVQAYSLAQLASVAQQEGDKESAAGYYEKLKSQYGELQEIQYYLKELNPNRRIMTGKPVPDFEVKLLGSGEPVSNKSLLGSFYLLDFWATWCGPCVAEMPNLHAAYEKFKDKNFTLLSLSFDAKPEDVVKFREKKWTMPWLHAFVEGGSRSELAQTFEVLGIPKPILVGPDGMILEVEGPLRGDNLQKTLARYLEGQSASKQ